ncbi:MAG: tetratricopeptide repeat protein [Spirochaetaceae bacterium]|nr:tetratricopeptide repeat protein [Spirochaetaceae bacterium]
MNSDQFPNEQNHDPGVEISELSKQGYQLLKEGLIERAIANFKVILEIQPDNNYALVGMGDAYRKDRRPDEAAGFYKDCLKFHPGNNYALFGLADCYKTTGQYNRAIEIWEKYLVHDDTNITVLTRVADAYRKVRNHDRSKELYLRVLEADANNSYALVGLGHLHYDFKEYAEALKYWLRLEDLVGRRVDIRVLTSIGNCHRKLKTFKDGVLYFKRALEKQPGNFYALFGLADCYRGMNESDQSLVYWNKILEKDPRNKVILTRAGDAYRAINDLDTAARCYRDALEIEYDVYAAMGIAIIDRLKGDYTSALSKLDELISKEPKNHRLYIEAANCWRALGDPDSAAKVIENYFSTGMQNEAVSEYARRQKKTSST